MVSRLLREIQETALGFYACGVFSSVTTQRILMMTLPPVSALTEEQAYALLDREAHRYLHMSAQDFILAWNAGKFDEDPDQPDVMYVAMLLPLVQ